LFSAEIAYFDSEVILRTPHARERLRRLRNLYGDVRHHQVIENQGLFQVGKKSESFVRFSIMAGEHGAADDEGDIVCQPLELMKLSLVKN
jgi:catalase